VFQTGDQIGSYSLIQKLGKGTFGEVWLAEEKTAITSHKVALKLPNEEDVDIEAIRQEADVWESVKGHPNILPIIKADIYEGQIYIASEYATDGSLSEWLKDHHGKAPTLETAVQMTLGILAGLEHLHSKGVIHRDLKPANILLQAETPRIADFGIARLIKSTATANSTLSAGTPSYMAPECFYGIRSEQTDIWAAGVLFHKLLTGKLPFSQPDQVSVMNAVLNSKPQIADEIPENLRAIIRKALQKEPAQRYQSAAEMRSDLSSISLTDLSALEEAMPLPAAVPAAQEFEKEEETVVRPQTEEIFYEVVTPKPSPWRKFLPVAVGLLLVLAAITVWSALQSGKSDRTTQTGLSNSVNESNINSKPFNSISGAENSANQNGDKKKPLTNSETNSNIDTLPSTDEAQSDEPRKTESPAPTQLNLQLDEPTPNANLRPRPRKTETPAPDDDDTPPPPVPSKSPSSTPSETDTPPPKPQNTKPTPRPTLRSEEPPPLPRNRNSNSN
jgi:serine/threonine protein kinase